MHSVTAPLHGRHRLTTGNSSQPAGRNVTDSPKQFEEVPLRDSTDVGKRAPVAEGARTATCERISTSADLPTAHGMFKIRVYRDAQRLEHVIIWLGSLAQEEDVLLRIHSQCMTSEVFGCLRCDCRQQLDAALEQIAAAGRGIVIYLRQEGRGIGLFNKIEAYALQDGGLDTVAANVHLGFPSDARTFETAVDVLKTFQVKSVQLLTNNPRKLQWLHDHGIEVTRRIPLHMEPTEYNSRHIRISKQQLNHLP